MARHHEIEPAYRAEDFVADGALRDVCVLDTTIDDRRRMFDGLPAVPGNHVLTWTLSGTTEGGALDASVVWSRREQEPEESASLAIDIDGVWFTCYFFDIEEIKFTFDPSGVVDEAVFAPVHAFVTWLGTATGREVIVTMEGTDHVYVPQVDMSAPIWTNNQGLRVMSNTMAPDGYPLPDFRTAASASASPGLFGTHRVR
jgi:hypothetical protein